MTTYLISIDFSESGPFTLEQLEELAAERKLTWEHYVLKMGQSGWFPAKETSEIKSILEKKFVFKSGDTGPAGGMIFFNDVGEDRHVMEAAPYDLGPASKKEAEKLCKKCSEGGVEWRFPDDNEVRSFAVARYHSPRKRGGYTYGNHTVLHWSSYKQDGKSFAVCTQEFYDTYNPWYQRPTSSRGPWIGDAVAQEETEQLPVRPVRLLKTIPRPEQKPVEKGYGSPAEPPV
jgi:hypothetical protein